MTRPEVVIQKSEFYTKYKDDIHLVRDALNYAVIGLFVLAVATQSFINLEEGSFPFNTGFMARMAYRQDTPGDAMLALMIGEVFGVGLVFAKRFFLTAVDKQTYETVKGNLLDVKAIDAPEEEMRAKHEPGHKDVPKAIASTKDF